MDFEYGPASIDAIYRNGSVHHFDEFLCQVQPKTCSLDIPVMVQINSFKALEQFVPVVRTDADSGIGNDNNQFYTGQISFWRQVLVVDGQVNRALWGVLDGVRKQVVYNLADSYAIANEP